MKTEGPDLKCVGPHLPRAGRGRAGRRACASELRLAGAATRVGEGAPFLGALPWLGILASGGGTATRLGGGGAR